MKSKILWVMAGVLLIVAALPQSASAVTYQTSNDVFYNFSWDWVKVQVRSCDDAACSGETFIGPDNTSGTWFKWPKDTFESGFLLKTNLSENRYFQYRAGLLTENDTMTPKLASASIDYANETFVSSPSISVPSASLSGQVTCSARGYSIGGAAVNLTFRWLNNSVIYNETNVTSTTGVQETASLLPKGIQKYGETWECRVRAWMNSTDYSEWKSTSETIGEPTTYEGTDDVFYDFIYMYNATNYNGGSIKIQARSCQQAGCSDSPTFIGPDNTSGTWFTNSTYNDIRSVNLTEARYFQYRAFLSTTDNTVTPRLFNVSVIASKPMSMASFELWAKPVDSADYTIFERLNTYRLYISGSKLKGGIYNGTAWHEAEGTAIISANIWHYFALAYSNETGLKIYLNGIEEASLGSGGSISSESSEVYIGGSGSFFNGTIDEVRIWNRALSPEEINASYNTGIHCYDNQTQIMTEDGWKYFRDVSLEDEVATLNSATKQTEYHNPTEIQNYAYTGEMYKVQTQNGDLIISPEHKVYATIDDGLGVEIKELGAYPFPEPPTSDLFNFRSLTKSLFVNPVVMVKILENNTISFDSEREYKMTHMNSLEFTRIMPKIFEMLNRSLITKSKLSDFFLYGFKQGKIFPLEFFQCSLNSGCVNIHNSSHHLLNSSMVLDLPRGFFFASSNFLTYSSFNSNSSTGCQSIFSQNSSSLLDNFPVLMYFSNITLFSSSSLPTSDQFTQGNIAILSLNDSSSETVMHVIYSSPLACNLSNTLNFFLMPSLKTSGQFISRCSSNLFFNSVGIEYVVLFIYNTSCDCIILCNCSDLFKSFDSEKSEFSLMPVSEVYDKFREGNNVVFLDETGGEIKVINVTKQDYDGRIYDVTVENHIILVKRNNLTTWSGNSLYHNFTDLAEGTYTYTAYAQDLAGNVNQTEIRTLSVDTTAPTYSLNSTNSTLAGREVMHSLYWQDNFNLDEYVFSLDNCTGTFVNYTWDSFSATPSWSNITKTISSDYGCTMRWCFYANDSAGNMNSALCDNPFTYIAECNPPDTGNWFINSTCSIADKIYTVPANVTIESNGVLELNGTTNLTFDQTNQHIFVYSGGEIFVSPTSGFNLP